MNTKGWEWWIRVDRLHSLNEVNYYYLSPTIFHLITFETDGEVKNEYGELIYLR